MLAYRGQFPIGIHNIMYGGGGPLYKACYEFLWQMALYVKDAMNSNEKWAPRALTWLARLSDGSPRDRVGAPSERSQ